MAWRTEARRHHGGRPSLRPWLDPRRVHVFRLEGPGSRRNCPPPTQRMDHPQPPSSGSQASSHAAPPAEFTTAAPTATWPATRGTARQLWAQCLCWRFWSEHPKSPKCRGASKEAGLCCAVGGGLVRARPPPTLLTSGCASAPCGTVLTFAWTAPSATPVPEPATGGTSHLGSPRGGDSAVGSA